MNWLASLRAMVRRAIAVAGQVLAMVMGLLRTRQAAVCGTFLATLLVGGTLGFQARDILGSVSDRDAEAHAAHNLAGGRMTKSSLTAARSVGGKHARSELTREALAPEAQALFETVRAGLTQPATTQVAGASSVAWRRGSGLPPLPEPPLPDPRAPELAARVEKFIGEIAGASDTRDLTDADCDLCAIEPAMGDDWDTYLGTTIAWHSDYQEAKRLAQQQNKLLFVMCVSGEFSDPGFNVK